jgi:hypothetical protein
MHLMYPLCSFRPFPHPASQQRLPYHHVLLRLLPARPFSFSNELTLGKRPVSTSHPSLISLQTTAHRTRGSRQQGVFSCTTVNLDEWLTTIILVQYI